MLIDSNLVFIDNKPVTTAVTGEEVGLTSFLKPGREEPIPLMIKVTEAFAGGTSLAIKLQQAEEKGGTYEDIPGASVTVLLADLTLGARIGWRFLPDAKKPWLKMTATPTGSFTAGKLFAAIAREDDIPYEAGMYIDAGKVKG